jgi:catechol 2,3-dioxygenase-like lactoylglutathione lyase family enzyme
VRKRVFSRAAVVVSCTDVARSRKFYEKVLGAVLDPGEEHDACPWFSLGGLRLGLMPNAARAALPSPEHAAMSLFVEVDDLESTHRELVRKGVTILQAPEGGPLAVIADPDGIVIEVWQAHAKAPS